MVCTVKDYQDARFLALHRIDTASLLEIQAVKPTDFDIDEFILREFGIRLGKEPLDLVMRIRGVLAKYLAETPVTSDQIMNPIDDTWTKISFRVQDTIQLRTWLRSMGPDAVVEKPISLKIQLESELETQLSLYRNVDDTTRIKEVSSNYGNEAPKVPSLDAGKQSSETARL